VGQEGLGESSSRAGTTIFMVHVPPDSGRIVCPWQLSKPYYSKVQQHENTCFFIDTFGYGKHLTAHPLRNPALYVVRKRLGRILTKSLSEGVERSQVSLCQS
jgi:hypothetical protein